MLNRFVSDLIENTRRRAQESGVDSLDEVRSFPERLAAFSPEVEAERREAKRFLYENLYESKPLQPEKVKAEAVITDVFSCLVGIRKRCPTATSKRCKAKPWRGWYATTLQV